MENNQKKKIINELERIIDETNYSSYDDYNSETISPETIHFDRGRLFVANFILWEMKK